MASALSSMTCSPAATASALPNCCQKRRPSNVCRPLEPEELRGGVVYYDGQFDDARLLIHLAMTAADHGATLLNYCPATSLLRDAEGYVNGLDRARYRDWRGVH